MELVSLWVCLLSQVLYHFMETLKSSQHLG